MKCRLSILMRLRTKKPWWKINRKPWSKFSPMPMDAVFKHGIRGDRQRILDGMPDFTDPLSLEFFANLGCPSASAPVEPKVVEVYPTEEAKDPVEGAIIEELG